MWCAARPVSYTHLDVYKRQTQDDTSEEEALQRQQMSFEEALSYEAHEPTLHDRINYAQRCV